MRIQRYDSLNLRDFKTPYEAVYAAAIEEIEQAPPPPPPPMFTQAELDAARQAGYKAGFEEGTQAGVTKVVNETHLRDNDAAEAMKKLATDIQKLQDDYARIIQKQTSELTELATLVARKVAHDALIHNADKMVEGMVMRCLPLIIYKPRVIIDVHPELQDKIEAHITTLLRESGFTGDLTIRSAPNLARYDVKIDWASGYAERSTEALWAEVENLLNHITLHSEETQQHIDQTTF